MNLAGLISRYAIKEGVQATGIPRLDLVRKSQPTGPIHAMHEQAVVFVAQGAKEVIVGEKTFANGPAQFLVVAADVPVIGRVTQATLAQPYLCMRLHLHMGMLRELIADGRPQIEPGVPVEGGLSIGDVTPELLSAAIRLVSLLGSPQDIKVLAPLAEREILYRLLQSSQASRLRQIARADSKLSQINKVIDLIKSNYDKPLRVGDLARRATMSPSALHEHFRAVTAMSPLQYQKRVRLQEARSLMLSRAVNAATAAYEVGYESPSQFSREYKRLFGVPPTRDQGIRPRATSRRLPGQLRSRSVNEA